MLRGRDSAASAARSPKRPLSRSASAALSAAVRADRSAPGSFFSMSIVPSRTALRSSSSSQRALSSSSSEGASRGSGARAAMSESVMREAPLPRGAAGAAGDGSGGDAGLGGEVGGPLPGLQPRDELHLPVEGQVYGLLAGRRGDARRLRPIYNGRAAAAGQLGRLGQAEPRRDGLHGELPGLQRVHADSNPDTGVSNFLSAPPTGFLSRDLRTNVLFLFRGSRTSVLVGAVETIEDASWVPALCAARERRNFFHGSIDLNRA